MCRQASQWPPLPLTTLVCLKHKYLALFVSCSKKYFFSLLSAVFMFIVNTEKLNNCSEFLFLVLVFGYQLSYYWSDDELTHTKQHLCMMKSTQLFDTFK